MLKIGDKVPPFALTSDAGKDVSLASLGAGPVVIYFYPKDDTPGCTREAQGFTAAATQLKKLGVTVLGVSKDSVDSHCRFRDKYRLNFPLLSDPDLAVHKAFGAWGEKNMYGKKVQGTIRSTFVVQNGKVAHVFPSVKVDGHVEAVIARISGGPKAAAAKPAAKKSAAKKTAAPARASKPTASRPKPSRTTRVAKKSAKTNKK